MTIYLHYNPAKDLRNLKYILKLKSLDYTQLLFFIVNDNNINLLNNMINKNYV